MRIAVIDIGTNSIRYLVAETHQSRPPEVISRGLTAPRLGEGLTTGEKLSEAAMDRTLQELVRIKDLLESKRVVKFKYVGTEALRLAANSDIFLRLAAGKGIKINVISGEEEARLIFAGAAGGLELSSNGYILVDPGGGSTEIITASEGKKPHFITLPLGCVRLKELSGFTRINRLKQYCRDLLETHYSEVPVNKTTPFTPTTLIGLGGTFTTLASIHLQLVNYDGDRVHGLTMTNNEIARIKEYLLSLTLEEIKQVPGIEPSRSDIIIPGIIIVQSIMEYLNFRQVTISDRGILWGLLFNFRP